MSASKLRALALDGNKKEFMSGLPSSMPKKSRSDMFNAVRKGMRIEHVADLLDRKILTEAYGRPLRDKRSEKLNKDLDASLFLDPPEADFQYVRGPKFLRLLRYGLVKSAEISPTRLAFADMQRSASAVPMRDRIFAVTQKTLDMVLSDDIIYRRFLILLQRMDLFKESHLSGLIKKSNKSEVGIDLILEVYLRGIVDWDESQRRDPNQYAFDRVNSFLTGGRARMLDEDLTDGVKVPLKEPKDRAGDWGTKKPANKYLKNTPGQPNSMDEIEELEYSKSINIDSKFSDIFTKE
jgi:hypothetical protein